VARTSIDCSDLIGQPWSVPESDCLAASTALLRRAGMHGAAESLVDCCSQGAPQAAWRELGNGEPLQVGDILISEEPDGLMHVSAVCEPTRERVISSSRHHGVFITRITKIRGRVGVYRYES